MEYVDGFLTPVPRAKKDEYRKLAAKAAAVLREYGALRVVECWIDESSDTPAEFFHAKEARSSLGDSLAEATSGFRAAARALQEETVVLSWVEWPSKVTRDIGMKNAMEDPRLQFKEDEPVFEGSRLMASGFIPILEV